MRITKMTASFGCLSGDTLELRNGLNLITAPNGGGKSTWCAFLRAMLYGLDTRARDKKGAPAEKNRRRPWNGDPLEGVLECEHRGQRMILRRSSEKGVPMGEVSLVFADTGLPVPGVTGENVGEFLTGVGREAFERSVFIQQTGLAVGQSRELEKRIAALVTSGQEEVTWSQTDERLRAWQRDRKHHNNGRLPKLEEEELEVRGTLSRMAELREDILVGREELRQLEAEREALAAGDSLTAQESQEAFDRRWAKAAADLDAAELHLQTVQENPAAADQVELDEMEEEINALEEGIRRRDQHIWWFALAGLALALLVLAATFIPSLGGRIVAPALCIAVAVVVVLAMAWNTYRIKADREDNEEIDRLQEEIDRRQDSLRTWREQIDSAESRRENARRLLDAMGARQEGVPWSAETAEKSSLLGEAGRELARMEGQLEAMGDPAMLEARLEEIQTEEVILRQEYDALSIAIEALEEADQELRSRFSPALNTRTGEYLALLTEGVYEQITLDRELDASVQPPQSLVPRPVSLLSQGTADQLYLAVRLAICDLVLDEGDPCPLILDDALTTFDDTRLALALACLYNLAQKRQIILFTCHKREEEILSRRLDVFRVRL